MGQNAVRNKIRLKICDLECVVTSEDKEDYVQALGVDVERTIQGLMGANGRVSLAMAATIAALSYCDDLHKEIAGSDHLRAQIKEYLDEATLAKEEVQRLQEENDNLRVGMDELCADIADLKVQLGAMSSAILSKSSPAVGSTLTPVVEPEQPVTVDLSQPVETRITEPTPVEPEPTVQPEPKQPAPPKQSQPEQTEQPERIALPHPEPTPSERSQPEPRQVEQTAPPTTPVPVEPEPTSPQMSLPKPVPPQAPLRRSNVPQPVQTGAYTRPKSPFEPDLPSSEGFVSFFEKT